MGSETTKADIRKLSFEFAIEVVKLYKHLVNNQKEFVMSKQLLRSGTSVGAMVREAQNAESKPDFIHKLGIAQKECDECQYWLELLFETQYIVEEEFKSCSQKTGSLLRVLKSIILSTKENMGLKKTIIHNS